MAPEPELLKRKRSRPSDWWANGSIISSTPQRLPKISAPPRPEEPPADGPAKNRGKLATMKSAGRAIQDAPAAGNRGKGTTARNREGIDGNENEGEDELVSGKSVRRKGPAVNQMQPSNADEPTENARIEHVPTRKRGRPVARKSLRERDDGFDADTGMEERGRLSVASPGVQTSLRTLTTEAARPSRLGQRPIAEASGLVNDRTPDVQAKPKKRTRQQLSDAPGEDELTPAGPEGRRRGRNLVEATIEDRAEVPVVSTSSKRRTKHSQRSEDDDLNVTSYRFKEPERGRPRTRRLYASEELPAPIARPVTEEERGRRRTRLSDSQAQAEPSAEVMRSRSHSGGRKNRQARARVTSTTVEVEQASSKLTKGQSKSKKVTRPVVSAATGSQDTGKNTKQTQASSPTAKRQADPLSSKADRKTSKNTAIPGPPTRKRKGPNHHKVTPNKRQRLEKPARQHEPEDSEVDELPMLYQHLKEVKRTVSLQVINAKWEPIPAACVDLVTQLFEETRRPVVVHLNKEQQQGQADTVLKVVSRRVISKLSKGLPFPPATRHHREDDFDFGKILDHNRVLEAQLTPVIHGNELLEAELKKETARLEADQQILAELESNAQSEAVTRHQATRKLHALVHAEESLLEIEAMRDDIGMQDTDLQQRSVSLDLHIGSRLFGSALTSANSPSKGDGNLQTIVNAMHGHVDSMQGNTKQVQGISEAILRSKGAVQATLFGQFSDNQYQAVILGPD